MRERAHLSRRALAVLPIAALATAALPEAAQAGDDAELLDLGRQWQACIVEMARLTGLLYEAEDRAIVQPYPEAIYFRSSDRRFWQFGEEPELIDALPTGRRFYRSGEARSFLRRHIEFATSLERDAHDVALIARATEILDAFDQWVRDCHTNEKRAGVPTAIAELERETRAGTEIRRKIAVVPARTIRGFIVKAALARWCMDDDNSSVDEMVEAALVRDELVCRDAASISLMRDLLAFDVQRGMS